MASLMQGADLNKTKKCLDGTRTGILPEIVSCFVRDRQAERREEKIFTTIARDQAGRDPSFRRALADVPEKDHWLKTASGVTEQWEKLILEPWSMVSGTMIGTVVDVLDESGPEGSRHPVGACISGLQSLQ